VDIYYQLFNGTDPTEDDEDDMKNLLVETIRNQANAGAFGDLGSVGSVEVTSNSGGLFGLGGEGSSGDDGSSDDGGISFWVYIGAAIGALLLIGVLYCFCCRGDSTDRSVARGKNDDTSDEEQDAGWFGGFNSDDDKRGYN
jgi:hypothetical protein